MNSNRILIIDQDATFIQTVSNYFKSIGIEVVSTGDGIEGYRMAKKEKPGVVILDTDLPNLNGFQVCRLLKGDDRYQQIPVVFVSSNDSQDDVLKSEKRFVIYFSANQSLLINLHKKLLHSWRHKLEMSQR